MQLFCQPLRPPAALATQRSLPNLDLFLMPQSTPRARTCCILPGSSWEVVQAAGQGMAIGVTFGERLSGRHRFGGGGGWRLARLGASCWMALLAVAGGALGQQDPNAAVNPKPPEKVVSISGNPAATD